MLAKVWNELNVQELRQIKEIIGSLIHLMEAYVAFYKCSTVNIVLWNELQDIYGYVCAVFYIHMLYFTHTDTNTPSTKVQYVVYLMYFQLCKKHKKKNIYLIYACEIQSSGFLQGEL